MKTIHAMTLLFLYSSSLRRSPFSLSLLSSFQAMPWDRGKILDELLELFVKRVTDSGGLVEKSLYIICYIRVCRCCVVTKKEYKDIMGPRIEKPGAGKRKYFRNPGFDDGGNPWRLQAGS